MAGSARLELASSSSPEALSFNAGFSNGQRGNFGGSTSDKSGSIRESIDSRMLTAGGTSRGGSTSVELPSLGQFLTLEAFNLVEQKLTRSGDLKRILGASLGTISDDHCFGTALLKPLNPVVAEELKRYRNGLLDASIKAKDRLKTLNDLIVRLDKYRHTLFSRKRQRNENSSSDKSGQVNLVKMMNHMYQPPLESGAPRLEDRSKIGVPKKRARTSMIEAEGRNTAMLRQAVFSDKDAARGIAGVSSQAGDKIRELASGSDGWEKKMKRKRSVGLAVNRSVDGDREHRLGVQQRLTDTRSRLSEGPGFRSGPSNGIIGVSKLEGNSHPSGSSGRTILRNEVDSVPHSSDRRDRVGTDKEKVTSKGSCRLSLCEDGQAGSLSPVTKGKASRSLRMGANAVANSSSFHRPSGAQDGGEQVSSTSKVQNAVGPNSRRRTLQLGSSTPSVAQWVGQRPQKISRTRRTYLVPPVSNDDDCDGCPTLDVGARSTLEVSASPLFGRGPSSNTHNFRLKFDDAESPVVMSESEESASGGKDKGILDGETEDRSLNATHKVETCVFTAKQNKIPVKEEVGDGVRRQGRSGRGSVQSRFSTPLTNEKLENATMTKLIRGSRPAFDKCESKSGRPPTKKSDRKAFSRPGQMTHLGLSEFTGESDDDHEELLAAARSARDASCNACSSSFWKTVEPIFAFLGAEDIVYLKEQIKFADELDASFGHMSSTSNGCVEELPFQVLQSSSALTFAERQGNHSNGMGPYLSSRKINSVIHTSGSEREVDGWLEKIIPLSQRLLSAFVIVDGVAESERRDPSYQSASYDCPTGTVGYTNINEAKEADKTESEIESEIDLKIQMPCSFDTFSCNGSTASNNFRSSNQLSRLYNEDTQQEVDGWGCSENGTVTQDHHDDLDQKNPSEVHHSEMSSFIYSHQQMSLDDRILAELHSIGIFPNTETDSAEEQEEICRDIGWLKKRLYSQVRENRTQLCNMEKAIQAGRKMEEGGMERLAMDKLVEIAYRKLVVCRNNSCNKSGTNKITKQLATAFVKRTLSRYRKFEDTGKSCFSEPPFSEMVLSASLSSSFDNSMKIAGDQYEAQNGQLESRGSVAAVGGRHASIHDTGERGHSDVFGAVTDQADNSFMKHDPTPKSRRREVLLDEVVGLSVSRVTSSAGTSLLGGAKGKRSERDRDQNKDVAARGFVAKVGRPSNSGNVKGERKTKSKPKQKIAQLSTSGSTFFGRFMEPVTTAMPSGRVCSETILADRSINKVNGEGLTTSKDTEDSIDLTSLPLPGMDSLDDLGVDDLGGQGNDLTSWLNFDADGLQETDLMGLGIPMDDLNMVL